jgi:hypothetical protein
MHIETTWAPGAIPFFSALAAAMLATCEPWVPIMNRKLIVGIVFHKKIKYRMERKFPADCHPHVLSHNN